MSEFLMPSLGADMEAGTLTEWYVKPGDKVKRGDAIAEVETQKGLIDIEVYENGIIEKLAHPESRAKVLYRLTRKGIDLLPIMIEINLWAEKYFSSIPRDRKDMLKKVKKDKAAFIKKAIKELES